MDNNNYDDLKNTLIYIKQRFGNSPFLKHERLLALMGDIAPDLKEERSTIKLVAKTGIFEKLADSENKTDDEKKQDISEAFQLLKEKEYVRPDAAAAYLKTIAEVFEWPVPDILKQPIVITPSADGNSNRIEKKKPESSPKRKKTAVHKSKQSSFRSARQYDYGTAKIVLITLLVLVVLGSGIFVLIRPKTSTADNNDDLLPVDTVPSDTAGQANPSDEITIHISGTDSNNRIRLEAGTGKINALDYVTVDDGLSVSASPEYIDTSSPGIQSVIYTVASKNETESKSFEQEILVEDTEAPIITLKESTVTVKKGSSYNPSENVESVIDTVDQSLVYADSSDSMSGPYYTISHTIDTKKAGVYTVTVFAEDSFGNKDEVTFKVKVQEEERFVAIPSGCTSRRTDYDTLFKELEEYGNEYTSPAYSTKDEMRMALKEFEKEKYPDIPCQVYPGLHISDGEEEIWMFYDYNPWDD